MTEHDVANSALAEIRANAERALNLPDGIRTAVSTRVARDVLALVEVAEAAQALITEYSGLGHSDEYLDGGLVSNYDRDLARLEQALNLLSGGLCDA